MKTYTLMFMKNEYFTVNASEDELLKVIKMFLNKGSVLISIKEVK